jgi:hypothetical protein
MGSCGAAIRTLDNLSNVAVRNVGPHKGRLPGARRVVGFGFQDVKGARMATAQTPAMADIHSGEHGHDQASPGEIAIGVIIGRTSEFFDFFVYAIASVIVFPRLVFPFTSELTGTLYAFMIFALAFIARPIGTVIFMTVDREYGKTAKLVSALFLLGTATVALAFLPGYHEIGSAAIWLLRSWR